MHLLLLCLALLLAGCQNQSESALALTFMTYNVGNNRGAPVTLDQLASAILEAGKPDILALQQVPWNLKLQPLAQALGYAHYIKRSETEPWTNLSILSTYPISAPAARRIDPLVNSEDYTPLLCAYIAIKGKNILVCTFRMESLSSALKRMKLGRESVWSFPLTAYSEFFRPNPRYENARDFKQWVRGMAHAPDGIIAGGDLNTVPWSMAYRVMTGWLNDALWPSKAFFTGTFRDLDWPVLPRIDHVFHSPMFSVVQARRLKVKLSDHYPVQVRFTIEPEGSHREDAAAKNPLAAARGQ